MKVRAHFRTRVGCNRGEQPHSVWRRGPLRCMYAHVHTFTYGGEYCDTLKVCPHFFKGKKKSFFSLSGKILDIFVIPCTVGGGDKKV